MRFLSKIFFFFFIFFSFFSYAHSKDVSPKKDSLIKEYFPSGHIKIKGKRYNGIWNGVVSEFYDVGKSESNIYKKTKYKKGVFKWEKIFNKNGKMIVYRTPYNVIKKPDCGC